MKKEVVEDFVGGKRVVQVGLSKRRVTKDLTVEGGLPLETFIEICSF